MARPFTYGWAEPDVDRHHGFASRLFGLFAARMTPQLDRQGVSMTFSSRPSFLATFGRIAPLALALVTSAGMLSGCENKHIGRTCELTVNDDGGAAGTGTTATINPEALECPSRICLSPGAEKGTDTAALCTADCSSDDDCSDGETGPKGDKGDHHCETGFVCMVPTTVGDFCCKKLCVCKDFVNIPMGGFKTPAVCMSGSNAGCKNVQ
jgi:hypothetical protein